MSEATNPKPAIGTAERGIFTAIERIRATSFVAGYQASDEECAGLALSHYFHWDGLAILKVASAALEDANFHGESALVDKMIEAAR